MKRWLFFGICVGLFTVGTIVYLASMFHTPVDLGYCEVRLDPIDWNLEGQPPIRTARILVDTTQPLRFSIISHKYAGEIVLDSEWDGVKHETVPPRLIVGKDGKVDAILVVRASDEKVVEIQFNNQEGKKIEKAKIIFSRPR